METLSLKFRTTAKSLQSWSDKRVGHFKSQLQIAREVVHQLEIGADSRQLTPWNYGWVASPVLTPAYSCKTPITNLLGTRGRCQYETLPRPCKVPKAKEFHCQFDK
jgi:hypothetical protein